jgi:hypothetical protein
MTRGVRLIGRQLQRTKYELSAQFCRWRLTKTTRKMLFYKHLKARSSVGERFLDAEEAKGSIPFAPTI